MEWPSSESYGRMAKIGQWAGHYQKMQHRICPTDQRICGLEEGAPDPGTEHDQVWPGSDRSGPGGMGCDQFIISGSPFPALPSFIPNSPHEHEQNGDATPSSNRKDERIGLKVSGRPQTRVKLTSPHYQISLPLPYQGRVKCADRSKLQLEIKLKFYLKSKLEIRNKKAPKISSTWNRNSKYFQKIKTFFTFISKMKYILHLVWKLIYLFTYSKL